VHVWLRFPTLLRQAVVTDEIVAAASSLIGVWAVIVGLMTLLGVGFSCRLALPCNPIRC
jgi:hypothetical protein